MWLARSLKAAPAPLTDLPRKKCVIERRAKAVQASSTIAEVAMRPLVRSTLAAVDTLQVRPGVAVRLGRAGETAVVRGRSGCYRRWNVGPVGILSAANLLAL